MRVLVINSNREQTPQTVIPVGACCIAAAADAAGHETHFLDLTFSRSPLRDVQAAVQRLHPAVIGLSIRNLDNCDAVGPHSYLPELRAIADTCRGHAGTVLVLGGAAVSLAPLPMLRYLGADYAIAGEGERVFIALLAALEHGGDPAQIPGVTGLRSDAEKISIAPLEGKLQTLPEVDFARWLSWQRYRSYDATYPVQTKRGCLFHCSYCPYPYLEGRCWRLRSPDQVADEAARVRHSGLRLVEFIDSVFGLPTTHAIACCEAIARRRIPARLCTMELNPLACVPELIQAMNAVRFASVAITAESGSDAMLAGMRKGYTTRELRRAAETLDALRAEKMWIFMIGAPGECEETVRETARFIGALPPSDLVYVSFGVRVLPGTELQQTLIAEGELEIDNDLLQPYFYHSPSIDPARARAILESSGFPSLHFVTLHDSAHPLLPTVQRFMVGLGFRPPYWRHLPGMNRIRRVLHI